MEDAQFTPKVRMLKAGMIRDPAAGVRDAKSRPENHFSELRTSTRTS